MARMKDYSMNYKTDGFGKDSQPVKPKTGVGRQVSRNPVSPRGETRPIVKSTSSAGKPLNSQAQKAVFDSSVRKAKTATAERVAARGALYQAPKSLNIPMGPKKTAMGVLKKVATAAMASPVGRAVGAGLAVGAALSTTKTAKKMGTAVADYAGKVTGASQRQRDTVSEATSSVRMKVKRK